MKSIQECLAPMEAILADIPGAIKAQRDRGKKIVGVFPIYAPEELVHAAGMFPVGCWGGNLTISKASALLPPFACPVMQGITELCMNGGYALLDGAVLSSPCDTLKCLTQNFGRTNPGIQTIFCNYPQNNKLQGGVTYIRRELADTARALEKLSGIRITPQALHASIEIYNDNRAAMMELTDILGQKSGILTAVQRYTVMKARWFMDKAEHTSLVRELCQVLKLAPTPDRMGRRVVLAGIMTEPAAFVRLLDELGYTVTADELAYESRQFRNPVPQDIDQMDRLALQWKNVSGCSVVFDRDGARAKQIVALAQKTKADGVIYCQMKFCEEEEFDFPYIRSAVNTAGLPILNLEIDPLSTSQEQSRTRLQAFAEQMELSL